MLELRRADVRKALVGPAIVPARVIIIQVLQEHRPQYRGMDIDMYSLIYSTVLWLRLYLYIIDLYMYLLRNMVVNMSHTETQNLPHAHISSFLYETKLQAPP